MPKLNTEVDWDKALTPLQEELYNGIKKTVSKMGEPPVTLYHVAKEIGWDQHFTKLIPRLKEIEKKGFVECSWLPRNVIFIYPQR